MTDSNSEIVKLQFPFQWEPDVPEITEIEIPRPKVQHVRGINLTQLENDSDELLKLVQKLTNKSPRFLDKIDMIDMMKIIEVVRGFLQSSPPTGGTAS